MGRLPRFGTQKRLTKNLLTNNPSYCCLHHLCLHHLYVSNCAWVAQRLGTHQCLLVAITYPLIRVCNIVLQILVSLISSFEMIVAIGQNRLRDGTSKYTNFGFENFDPYSRYHVYHLQACASNSLYYVYFMYISCAHHLYRIRISNNIRT